MMVRPGGRSLASGVAALALSAALTGCADEAGTTPSDIADSSSPAASPTTAAPSQSPSPTASTPPTSETPSPTGSPPVETSAAAEPSESSAPAKAKQVAGIRGKLLTAEEVPGFNDEFTWRERSTRRGEGGSPFGTCHRFAMTSIGASKVAVRTYRPATKSPGSTASNLVARFADEMTAKRAYAVLTSWREQCKDQLEKHDDVRVGKLQRVPVAPPTGVGSWYLLVYGPAGDQDSGYFDAQGLTRVGSTISVLQMRLVGQDYNYRHGKEPMVGAVKRAAARIG